MQRWRPDRRDHDPLAINTGNFDVVVNAICPRHVWMDDVDDGHHLGLAVWWTMLYVVSYLHIRPYRQAQRISLYPSRRSPSSFRPLKLSPNQNDEGREEDHLKPKSG
jgi:hypothetical protein